MKSGFFFICVIIFSFILSASEIEDNEKNTINEAIDMMYKENFEEALAIFIYIKDTYPDYPLGDFLLGFYYNFLASFYETDIFDSKIVLYYDMTEKKAEYHLKFNKDDPWFNFYKGASLINRGIMLGRDGKRFSGITKTFDGISYIEECLEKEKNHGDALVLLGSYKYYKSAILSWVYDRRDSAVKILIHSIDTSYFSKYLAVSTLGWIYIDYEKFIEAEKLADLALDKYPDSHLFLFLKARSLFEMKKHKEAAEIYYRLETKFIKMKTKYSEKDLFNTYYFLSKCNLALKDMPEFDKYTNLALSVKLSEKEKDLLKERFEDLTDLKESEGR